MIFFFIIKGIRERKKLLITNKLKGELMCCAKQMAVDYGLVNDIFERKKNYLPLTYGKSQKVTVGG